RVPQLCSTGALDMVNIVAPETMPERYRQRKVHVHSPQVTLMLTTPEENERMGRLIGERLNQMDGPVRFFMPEGGVSALDAQGQPFWDPEADAALFRSLERTVRATGNRQLIRVQRNINDPEFASTIVNAFRPLLGRAAGRPRPARRSHGLWRRQRHRARNGGGSIAGRHEDPGARRRQWHRSLPRHGHLPRSVEDAWLCGCAELPDRRPDRRHLPRQSGR